jgi:cation:H+ antiporter
LLLFAAVLTGALGMTVKTHPKYWLVCVGLTGTIAVGFFFLPAGLYAFWIAAAVVVSGWLFFRRPGEALLDDDSELGLKRYWFIPAAALLVTAGYFLDPVVSYTATHSKAPKGVIGFFVLSALTSWPEFKSCLSLFRRRRPLAAVLNITVSNVTNIWLAVLGVAVYLLMSTL